MLTKQMIAAALALLLTLGLTACNTDTTTTTNDTSTTTNDTTTDDTTPEDPDADATTDETDATEDVRVLEQVDELTLTGEEDYQYALAMVGGVTDAGDWLMQVLYVYQPGETVDFRTTTVTTTESLVEEVLVTPSEQLVYFVREDDQWAQGSLDNLRADQYVYLTRDAETGEVYAITATEAVLDTTGEADVTDDTVDETTDDTALDETTGDVTDETTTDETTDETTDDTTVEGDTTDETTP